MSRYESIDCPICKKPLENGDEIVVCPECGAPYHRSCFKEEGRCIFPELHEKGEAWQAPKQEKEEPYDKPAGLRCTRCGTLNPAYGLFCQVCGNQLNNQESGTPGAPARPQGQAGQLGPDGKPLPPNPYAPYGGAPPFGGPGGPIPPEIPLNPYTTPFGGVAPDEVIDGIPAKDLAIFVNRNSHYFLPRFKQLAQTKSKIINWSAAIFEGGYFLYRKMYGIGILMILVNVLLSLPQAMILVQTDLNGVTGAAAATGNMGNLATLNIICSLLGWGMRFFCGFFANSFYFSHCKRKISEAKGVQRSEDEYYTALSKKGSVATKLVTGLLIGYAALNMLSMYLLLIMG